MSAALLALPPSIASAQVVAPASVAPSESSPTAGKTIEIPQDTPVIVHFFMPYGPFRYNANYDTVTGAVLQVDSDVVINGVIVIPAGSLGLAHIDRINYDRAKLIDGSDFHMLWVFSIASTQLALDPAPVPTVMLHHNVVMRYTAKLMHAIVTLPE